MRKLNKPIPILKFLFMALILKLVLTSSQESDFDYSEGDKGPKHWGGECNKGKLQSPINVSDDRLVDMDESKKVTENYADSAEATLINKGHNLEVKFKAGKAGSIQINGTNYSFLQMHWHSPSEHTINGNKFDLEQHMVHKNEKDEYAVIAALYILGNEDSNIKVLEPYINEIIKGKKKVPVGKLRPRVFSDGLEYYRYLGSLTTPPCSEIVIWTIKKNIRTISKEQLQLFKNAVNNKDNARPLQSLNNRIIFSYTPTTTVTVC